FRRGARGESEGRRRARDGERGSLRRRVARSDQAQRSLRGRLAARRRGVPQGPSRAVSFLSLTERDREQMLGAIGVSSVEELFAEIPEGVRFQRELDLEPALSEPELVAHLEALAARNVHTGEQVSF